MGPNFAMMSAASAPAPTAPQNQNLFLPLMVSAITESVGSMVSGFSQLSASRQEAAQYDRQAKLREAEGLRDAEQRAEEVASFQARQGRQYLASGVTLEGTPALVMERTRQKGQEEVRAMQEQANAEAALMRLRGLQARKGGRDAMFGSLINSVSPHLNAYFAMQRYGILGDRSGRKGTSSTKYSGLPVIYSNSDKMT